MKILQVVHKPQRRGAEVFALQLSRQLRRMGHEVRTVYLYPHDGPNPLPRAPEDQVLGRREHHCFERIPGAHPILLGRLRRCIDEMGPDVVQANGGRTVKYSALAAFNRQQRAWVLVYRNIGQPRYWANVWHQQFYSHLIMPYVDAVVGVSESTLQAVKDMYPLSVPTTRIPSAVDPEAIVPTVPRQVIRHQTDTPAGARVVVYVGSLTLEKRVDRLLRVVEMARRSVPDLHLWIVGDGPKRVALEEQVEASSLGDRVRFLGMRQQDEVTNYVSAADVMALTSDSEGMPGVLLEAGLLQRAVVATRVGGVDECVLNGQTGILIDRNDECGFAETLGDLLQRPEYMRRLGSAAGRWVEENFTIARIAEEYEALYEDVLARRSPSRQATRHTAKLPEAAISPARAHTLR